MIGIRRGVLALAVAGSLAVGGVAGAALYAATNIVASAATSSNAATPAAAASPAPPSGKFVSNEDPTHEKGESAAREAQENAGQVPTVP